MLTLYTILALTPHCAPTVPPDTLTESGFHPYAIAEIIPLKGGSSRVVSHHPPSREAALTLLEDIKAKKHPIPLA